MKIKIIKGVVVCGEATKAGQVIDASERVSAMLIRKGKAEEVTKKVFEAQKDEVNPASRVSKSPSRKVSGKAKQSETSK